MHALRCSSVCLPCRSTMFLSNSHVRSIILQASAWLNRIIARCSNLLRLLRCVLGSICTQGMRCLHSFSLQRTRHTPITRCLKMLTWLPVSMQVHPIIGDEAAPLLAQGYLDMRMLGQDPSGNVNRCAQSSLPLDYRRTANYSSTLNIRKLLQTGNIRTVC